MASSPTRSRSGSPPTRSSASPTSCCRSSSREVGASRRVAGRAHGGAGRRAERLECPVVRQSLRCGRARLQDPRVRSGRVDVATRSRQGKRGGRTARSARRGPRVPGRCRPSRLVFPPEVTSLFDGVRQQTKAVAIALPGDTTIVPGPGAFGIWIIASSFQLVDVTLRYEDGAPFRPLYSCPIGDSLNVQWDGLDAAGALPAINRVLLRVASRAPTGELAGIVQIPLDLRLARPDTLPLPPPPAAAQFLPERARSGAATRAVMGGALLSGVVALLPAVVGGTDTQSGPRMAVAGTIGVAGLVGFVLHRPGRPLPANVRANKALRDAWQQH